MTSLNGAVAHASGPSRPVVVGDNLDFDVTRSFHQLLHENGWISEGLKGLGPRALKSLRKLFRRMHHANSVAAAAGRGLNKEGIAETLGVVPRLRRSFPPGRRSRALPDICSCSANRFEAILSPTRRITSPSGPMNTIPSSWQRSAKAACSATKPHPTQTASARATVSARPSRP